MAGCHLYASSQQHTGPSMLSNHPERKHCTMCLTFSSCYDYVGEINLKLKTQTQNSNSKLKLKTQIQTQRSNTKNYFFSKNLKNIRFCDSFCSNMSYYHTFLFSLHERGGLGFIITLTHWKSNWYIIK